MQNTMATENVANDKLIYTDGHDVVVTESTFKVKNTSYRLNGITRLSLWTIRPDRWPGILCLLLGLTAVVCGVMGLIPADVNLATDEGYIGGNELALYIGAGVALLGIILLAASKERYAVHIATAEGEKNAVVSTKREYIAQIVDALHSAFDMGHINSPIVIQKK
jgi:hypothetical protein